MKLIIRPKLNIFIIAILSLMAICFTLPYWAISDRFLTVQLQTVLQKALKGSGLQLEIQNIHWETLNGLTGTRVAIKDKVTGEAIITAKQIKISINPLVLALKLRTPEAAINEAVLIQPRLRIRRLPDDSFSIQQYFNGKGRRLRLSGIIKIQDGEAFYQDYQFGNYRLYKFSGTINLRQYPLLQWQLHGRADVGKEAGWQSEGRLRTDQQVGYIGLTVKKALITKICNFIPQPFPYRAHSGWADVRLDFALAKGYFGIENIQTTIHRAGLSLPQLSKPVTIQYLQGNFTPELFQVRASDILYEQTAVHISGTLEPRSAKVKAVISAERINLEDWIPFISQTEDFQAGGKAAFKLRIHGTINSPDISGEIALENARIQFPNEEPIRQISGRLAIAHNDLNINHLKGVWRESRMEIRGRVKNIFAPRFDIKATGSGFQLQDLKLFQTAGLDIKTGGDSAFEVMLTGGVQNPQLECLIAFQQVNFTPDQGQEIPFTAVKLKFTWNPGNIKIHEAGGNLWEGRLDAKGSIRFKPEGIQWLISGKFSSLDLEKVSFLKSFPVKGKISTDMVLKGNWLSGEPFKLGNVFGTFTGNNLNYSDALIEEADGVFSVNEGVLTVDSIQAKINQGRLFGYLQLNRQSEILVAVNAENIKIRDLFPDAVRVPFDGLFNGSFDFKGPVNSFSGRIHGAFTNLTWNSKPIGNITGNIDYRDQVFSVADLQIDTELGPFSVEGKITMAAEPLLNINITGANTNLKGLAKWLPVDPDIPIEGLGQLDLAVHGNITNPHFKGKVKLTNPAFGMLKMQAGEIELEGDLQEISLTQCWLRNGNFELRSSGTVNRDWVDLKIAAHSFDLSALRFEAGGNSLQGLVDFNGRFSGPTNHPVLTVDVSGGHFSLGDLTYQTLNAKLQWDLNGLNINQAEFKQGTSVLKLNGRILFGKPLQCNIGIEVVDCELSKLKCFLFNPLPPFPLDGMISGMVDINGPIDNPEIRANGNIRGNMNERDFDGSFNLFYSKNKIAVEKFKLNQGNGTLVAAGNWEARRGLNLSVTLLNFPLEVANHFTRSPLKLAGTANAEMELRWNLGKIGGEWNFEVADFALGANSFGNIKLAGGFANRGILMRNGIISGKNGNFRGQGYISWPEAFVKKMALPVIMSPAGQPMELNITVKNLPLSLCNDYFKEFTIIDGTLSSDLKIEGDLASPRVSGRLDCVNLKTSIAGLPLPVENMQVSIEIKDNQIRIRRVRGIYGVGRFNIAGGIENDGFKQFRLNLSVNGSRLYYKNQFFDGYGDARLKLAGPVQDLLISGNIVIYDSRVGIIGVSSSKFNPATWQPQFNLRIKAGANTRFRVIGLADLPINGEVQLKGNLAEPALEGEVGASSGVLTFYSNAFRIKKAKAVFKFSQGFNPYLEMESSLRRAQAEIFLNIKGIAPDNINISLTSQPYMPQANILGLLNWMQLGNNQTLSPEEVISGNISFVTDTIFEDFLYQLRQTLNVKYLYLEPDRRNNDFRINMGSYLTQQLSYSFSRSIFPENKQSWNLSLSYYLNPYLSLEYNYSMLDGTIWRLIYQIKL